MIILDIEVYEALRSRLGSKVTVLTGFPIEYHDLPVVSYTCTNNNTAVFTDNEEAISFHSYKIDIFYDDNTDWELLVSNVNYALTEIGFTRTMYQKLVEEGGNHIVMYYSVYIDEKSNKYYAYKNAY